MFASKMAWLVLLYIFNYMETLHHIISHAWLHFNPTTLCREGEKTFLILKLFLHFAYGWNRTRSVSSASECAIHNTIAPWLVKQHVRLDFLRLDVEIEIIC